jgi:DNA replication protein DnaC
LARFDLGQRIPARRHKVPEHLSGRVANISHCYGRLDLLLLDELGYVQVDPRGAELLFQIITEREERASIAIGTNLPFSEWGTVFPDPRLVAAIVDRVTFNAHSLETGTQSYRLATSKTSSRKRAS